MSVDRLLGWSGIVCLIMAFVVGGVASGPLLVAAMVLLLVVVWRHQGMGPGSSDGAGGYGQPDSGHHGGHHHHGGGFDGSGFGGHGFGGHGFGGGDGGHGGH